MVSAGLHLLAELQQVASTAGRGTIAFAILLALFVGAYQADQAAAPPGAAACVRSVARPPDAAPAAAPARLGRPAVWIAVRPVWRYVLRPLWMLIAPPLRFLVARADARRAGHRAHHPAGGRGSVDLRGRAADRPARDRCAAAGDESALRIARDIEMGMLTTIAKVLAVIGRLWFVVLRHGGRLRLSAEAAARPRGDRTLGRLGDHADHDPDHQGRGRPAPAQATGSWTWTGSVSVRARLDRGHYLALGGGPVPDRTGRVAGGAGDRRRRAGGRRSASRACTCGSTT